MKKEKENDPLESQLENIIKKKSEENTLLKKLLKNLEDSADLNYKKEDNKNK